MVVQHNIPAMNANRYFGINNSGLSKSLEKLSSGYAINRAGDNAAGLAVSEKMRSQIAGLTQGVKNAQDGISMIQTFEGALTETDSILQRMKTLADQAANGTYQDEVDRDAIQLEFDQLNDELNQIADTDFNGVIVLNGGEMSDGLKAVNTDGAFVDDSTGTLTNGNFDYANKKGQVIDAANKMYNEKVTAAKKALDDAKAAIKNTPYDLSDNGTAPEWNKLDNNLYTKDEADALWKAMKITKKDADGSEVADVSTINEVAVTFERGEDGSWTAKSAVDNTGNTYDASSDVVTAFSTTPFSGTNGTGKGGFAVNNYNVSAIFDDKATAKKGDTVTIKFSNDEKAQYAPNGIGFADNSLTVEKNAGTAAEGLEKGDFEVELADDVKDVEMTDDLVKAFDAINGLKFTATYDKAGGSVSVKITGNGGSEVTLANNINYQALTGTKLYVKAVGGTDNTKGSFEIYDGNTATAKKLATVTFDTDAANDVDGIVKGQLAVSAYANKVGDSISATVGKNDALTNSTAAQGALKKAQDAYDAVVAKKPDGSFESAKAFIADMGVSMSDSFDQSNAKLTYTNNITLQSGARTKDSVNFTFKYASQGLGDLKANMNCSARADGLNTANLSLKTAKDANYAIDRIDNAINKVSMVRATFGAVQNRLEHKIDNMNVTKENMTSAESRIRDTNMAEEMTNFTKNQILAQASQAMLAQANQLPQGVLQLLG